MTTWTDGSIDRPYRFFRKFLIGTYAVPTCLWGGFDGAATGLDFFKEMCLFPFPWDEGPTVQFISCFFQGFASVYGGVFGIALFGIGAATGPFMFPLHVPEYWRRCRRYRIIDRKQ